MLNHKTKWHASAVKSVIGENLVLLEEDDNLLSQSSFNKEGWAVLPLLSAADFNKIRDGITQVLQLVLSAVGVETGKEFSCEKYHQVVNDRVHQKVIKRISSLPIGLLPIDLDIVPNCISNTLKVALSSLNPVTGLDIFHIRIVRPGMDDFNPLHKDVWLDRLRNGVNLYLPLFGGGTSLASLPLVTGSQWWPESEIERSAAGFDQFTVPAVLATKRKLEIIRPEIPDGSGLIFSPYMLHGGADNLNVNETRISIEMRLFRKGT